MYVCIYCMYVCMYGMVWYGMVLYRIVSYRIVLYVCMYVLYVLYVLYGWYIWYVLYVMQCNAMQCNVMYVYIYVCIASSPVLELRTTRIRLVKLVNSGTKFCPGIDKFH